MKESRLLVTRYLCGKPIKQRGRLVKSRKGFPVFLSPFKELIHGNIAGIKYFLSVLNITRGLQPLSSDKEILPDFSTVDGHYKGVKYFIPKSFIMSVLKEKNLVKGLPK
jgi:hypothetical protein